MIIYLGSLTHNSHGLIISIAFLTNDTIVWYHFLKSSKEEINEQKASSNTKCYFKNPVQSNVKWNDIEKLFINLGADISEGSGSRVRVALRGIKAVFHRPHPQRETDKGALMSVRRFLQNAGVYSDKI